ncbi:MAG: hypothetical protein VW807_05080 [Paracoccaceae bacterium]
MSNKSLNYDFRKLSDDLDQRIKVFKLNQHQKAQSFSYEQNQFDIYLSNIFETLIKIILFINKKLEVKKISIEIFKMIKTLFDKLINCRSAHTSALWGSFFDTSANRGTSHFLESKPA